MVSGEGSAAISEYFYWMPPNDEQGRPERPDYKVYRSRRGPRFGKQEQLPSTPGKPAAGKPAEEPPKEGLLARLRGSRQPSEPTLEPEGGGPHWLRWVGLALLGWVLLSFVAFAISAQIQKSKLADMGNTLGSNPFLLVSPQNILVLGTDTRDDQFASAEEAQDAECVEAAASGETPPPGCFGSRADTIMILRAGGGAFEKLSIPRDTFAAVPGQENQKINGAYAFGGAKLQVQTVEQLLGIDIDHVAIVDFAGFVDFIDAIGGVKVTLPRPVCNVISGTFELDLNQGERTLNGEKALALARTRTSTCGDDDIDDLTRTKFQQLILQGIKDRLTDPLRIPRNFLFGPLIGWNAPKAMVSDLGALTMPQLVLAAAIGGSSDTEVLKPSGAGPNGSLIVPVANCIKAVQKLTGDPPENDPLCSPG